jgi:alkylation response protein AidB-like acyl-CoA dehydrogenase
LTYLRILPEILTGQKRICLAITEPSAGSDVRNITTTAKETADGKHYIVNGEKKISPLLEIGLILKQY